MRWKRLKVSKSEIKTCNNLICARMYDDENNTKLKIEQKERWQMTKAAHGNYIGIGFVKENEYFSVSINTNVLAIWRNSHHTKYACTVWYTIGAIHHSCQEILDRIKAAVLKKSVKTLTWKYFWGFVAVYGDMFFWVTLWYLILFLCQFASGQYVCVFQVSA